MAWWSPYHYTCILDYMFIKEIIIEFSWSFIHLVCDHELICAYVMSYVFCVSMWHYEQSSSPMTFSSCLRFIVIMSMIKLYFYWLHVGYHCDFFISYLLYRENSSSRHSAYYVVVPSMLKLMTYFYMFMC